MKQRAYQKRIQNSDELLKRLW